MTWFHGLEPILTENVSLADKTWYRIGGPARYYCVPTTTAQVADLVERCSAHNIPLRVLGAGANVLIRDRGFPGVVVQLDRDAFGNVLIDGTRVVAGSAVDCPNLVRRTVRCGLAGLEVLAGIPGTVGGVVRMNAGGKYGDVSASVVSVTLVDAIGTLVQLDRTELEFDYRRTNLTGKIVLKVEFELRPHDSTALLQRYTEIWDFKKESQRFARNNAGCTFKNPAGYSAGALIDQAGLKGERCGGAHVCTRHANFIIAEPQTRADDILALADRVRQRVQEQFDIELEMEIDVW
jgi:UDP-N-acetylmuramate dehydrogenase